MKHLNKFNEAKKTKTSYSASELKEKIKNLEEEIDNCDIISHESFDWKEINRDAIQKWKKSIEELGGYFTMDPSFEGSDIYGFYISKKPIDKKILKQLDKLYNDLEDLK
jgi:hypothetical protein